MRTMKLTDIVVATGGTLIGEDISISGVVADSRKARPGCLFVALRGAQADGHDFYEQALAGGAKALLVTKAGPYGCPYILVEDTVISLAQLAKSYLARSSAKVVAITGSVGKTSAKEMTAAAIAAQMTVCYSPGNMNTEVGLPLSVLQHEYEEIVVLEMGMRGLGQIRDLADIAPPDIGIVTNVGEAHLEVLGSRDNIAKAKGELLAGMKTGGIAVINRDDDYYDYLAGVAQGPVISFGYHPHSDYRIISTKLEDSGKYSWTLATGTEHFRVQVPWPGRHNILNSAAALAAASAVGVDIEKALAGLMCCRPGDRRLDIVRLSSGVTIIDDTYNASPASTLAALEILRDYTSPGRRIAVLGDMLELGPRTMPGHVEVGEGAAGICDLVVTIGKLGGIIADTVSARGSRAVKFPSKTAVVDFLLTELRPDDVVLVKGSRGLKLEETVSELRGALEGDR